jgi:predicted HNH restriction endonuclease
MEYDIGDRMATRKQIKDLAIEYKGRTCEICGYGDHLPHYSSNAMDFHHISDFTKEFSISDKMTSFEMLKDELDKCVLVCARCHRELHDGRHSGYVEGGWGDY